MNGQDETITGPSIAPGTRSDRRPGAIQVICLGSGGGPSEDNVTGLLIRSSATAWAKGSILAVDAGSHLAAITRILEKQLPLVVLGGPRADSNGNIYQQRARDASEEADLESPGSSPRGPEDILLPVAEPTLLESGPFAGLPLPHASARANAAHVVRSQVSTYLITHPHLDHLSGFAINTAAFHATSRPKRLAALPFTVDAIKQHIFNDVIWPNLTDEDGGVGFVTFQRLKEGGDVMVGEGEGRGYIEVCEGLAAKGFGISHGKCMKSASASAASMNPRLSMVNPFADAMAPGPYTPSSQQRRGSRQVSLSHQQALQVPHSPSSGHAAYQLSPSAAQPQQTFPGSLQHTHQHTADVVGSTAYFVRDVATSKEVLVFGDVEPDSISIAPRLAGVWMEAAPKIAAGVLGGIFIECSYDDSQADAVLFGHLAPRHLVAEMQVLAELVREEKAIRAQEKAMRKRKRAAVASAGAAGANGGAVGAGLGGVNGAAPDDYSIKKQRSRSVAHIATHFQTRRASTPFASSTLHEEYDPDSPMTPGGGAVGSDIGPHHAHAKSESSRPADSARAGEGPPLKGLRVIIIHVKDTLTDGPHVSERILAQLDDHAMVLEEKGAALGCEFVVSESGMDYWF